MKKLNNTFTGLILAITVTGLVGLGSCKKKKDFSGKELATASSSFDTNAVNFTVNNSSPNFKSNPNDYCEFTADFPERVSWTVTIKGIDSEAEKVFSGVGNKLENVLWDGASGNVYFFGVDDSVVAYLDILGLEKQYSVVLDLLQPKNYHSNSAEDVIINGVRHILIDNFNDGNGEVYEAVSAISPSPDNADSEVNIGFDKTVYCEGGSSYRMQGRDDNDNGWSGGVNHENLVDFYYGYVNTDQLLIDSGIDPTQLYINAMVYGAGYANTAVQFKVYEQDPCDCYHKVGDSIISLDTRQSILDFYSDNGGAPANTYDQKSNDGYIYNVEVTWTGWKMVSIPYSSFIPNNDPLTGGGGDRVKESFRITGMAVSLLSYPATGAFTKTYVDFLTITQGGRFQR